MRLAASSSGECQTGMPGWCLRETSARPGIIVPAAAARAVTCLRFARGSRPVAGMYRYARAPAAARTLRLAASLSSSAPAAEWRANAAEAFASVLTSVLWIPASSSWYCVPGPPFGAARSKNMVCPTASSTDWQSCFVGWQAPSPVGVASEETRKTARFSCVVAVSSTPR